MKIDHCIALDHFILKNSFETKSLYIHYSARDYHSLQLTENKTELSVFLLQIVQGQ